VEAPVRVLISGMGGELGSRVAALLEQQDWAGEITGVDIDPPRGRLRRASFHRLEPRDRRRTVAVVKEFDPEIVLHLGIWEPHARANPPSAVERSHAMAVNVLGAAAECRSLKGIAVRSGIEVYGRRRSAPTRPDESAAVAPTSTFGRILVDVERTAERAGAAAGVPVTHVRLGPVVGPHVPSPLGRYLRLPVVPVSLVSDPAFSLVHIDDAARALIAAAHRVPPGPVNVVARGAVTATQAVRMGSRLPMPIVGPQWRLAQVWAAAAGAPLPDHVIELMTRGRTADAGRVYELLGTRVRHTTADVVEHLFEWAGVHHLRGVKEVA
jgi:UDP-glucose 4-epimerase